MIVKIDKLSHDLNGISKINGKVTFIPNTLPKEVVDIKLIEDKKNYSTGKVLSYIEKNKDRKDNPCPYFSKCGGCSFSGISYQKSLEYKKEVFIDIFKKYTNLDINPNIIASNEEFNYRNKITMKVDKGHLSLTKEESNNLINIDYCYLVNDNINKIIKKLNVIDLTGLNEVIIRGDSEIMVILKGEYDYNNIIDILKEDVTSIIYNDKCIYGKEYITMDINNYKYAIYPDSFFQINTSMINKMYSKIKEYAGSGNSLLDLYCGAGTIGIYLSDNFKKIKGIEINKDAIKGANFNKELNNINNITFELNNVNKNINITEDVVVVDPPRSGLDDKTRSILLNSKVKKIVYMSCNPITLARDINILKENYNLKDITIFDNFPNTKHMESICFLERR